MIKCFDNLCWRLLLLSVVALAVGHASAAHAKTFTVNSTADVVDQSPGNGQCYTGRDVPGAPPSTAECTLRAAIQESNALTGKDEIVVPSGTYALSQPTQCRFRSRGDLQTFTTISLCLTSQVAISGAGAGTTIIEGGNLDRVSLVSADAEAEIRGVTIQHGAQPYGGSFIGGGAGINNQGTLTLIETVFNGNRAQFGTGGGIHNAGTLTVNKSTFIGNNTTGQGGGIFNYSGKLTVTDSLFTSNTAVDNGGGITSTSYTGGDISRVTVAGSTFTNNEVSGYGSGGAIVIFYDTATITNSTLSGNSSWTGGGLGIGQFAHINLNNVTITQNRSRNGGGGIAGGSNFTLRNTLIAGNTDEQQRTPDCQAVPQDPLTSQGHNLIQNPTGCNIGGNTTGNIIGQDPHLGLLTNNGGTTPTHALLAGSPAIDAGDPAVPGSGGTSCAAADQRRLLRPLGNSCDIGAFEGNGGFAVLGIQPNAGGNTAPLITTISGSGFQDGADVRLRRAGQPDIIGTSVVVEAGGSVAGTTFDLNGKALGAWDVVVTNPDATSMVLPSGFTIEQTRAPELWSQVVGRSAIRPGLPARYNIIYGNRGNVDALGVPLTITTPAYLNLNVYFQIKPPPPQAGQVPTDWTLVPVEVLPSTETGVTNVLLFLPVIPAGFTGALRISLTLPPTAQHGDSFTFSALLGTPIFNPELNPVDLNKHVSGARAYAEEALGVVIPPALIPELNSYAIGQFQNMIASDRETLVSSLGTRPEVYSLGQLTIDLARYGAARATTNMMRFKRLVGANPDWRFTEAERRAPIRSLLGATTTPTPDPCKGKVLPEGQSCGDPPPTPVPDPKTPKPPRGLTPSDCLKELKHHISADGKSCQPDDKKNCPIIPDPFIPSDPLCARYPIIESVDPNDKVGPLGVTDQRFRTSNLPLSYTIHFENQPTATAPAQTVTVTDQLDIAKLDLNTFNFGPVSFGNYTLSPTPTQHDHFTAAMDLRPAQNLIVKVDGSLNKVTGLITWQFTSLDGATQEPTEDPLVGFLPPNTDPPAGEGSVLFTVMPKQGLATGTEIRNSARIVFDVNAPIDTPEWLTTIDDTKPVSQVSTLADQQTSTEFTVNWSGTDTGSGILDYTIYVSVNGGAFTPWLSNTTATSAVFQGQPNTTYAFYSVARDNVEHLEDAPPSADATTLTPPVAFRFENASDSVPESAGSATITVTRLGSSSGVATVNYTASNGTATAGADYNAASGTLTFADGVMSQSFTIAITDDAVFEGNETINLSLSDPSSGTVLMNPSAGVLHIIDNEAAPAGTILISEFRLSGPNGTSDEFIELYNSLANPITVSTTDGSAGWSLVASDGVVRFTIANGTIIPGGRHYLATNGSGYNLVGLAAGDQVYAMAIPDNLGLALFKTAQPANFNLAQRLDAVGFSSVADTLYREGGGLPAVGSAGTQYSWVRQTITVAGVPNTGRPQDTGDNAADFLLVASDPSLLAGPAARLGAPGPENLSSPIQRNAQIRATLLDPAQSAAAAANRYRYRCTDADLPAACNANSPLGYLSIRRTYTNNTGQPITRLRFRVVDISTTPEGTGPGGNNIADLRVQSRSGSFTVTPLVGAPLTVQGLTLEQSANQPLGGGFNSSLVTPAITLERPLSATPPNNQIRVEFLLGIVQGGNFRFFVNVEALP